MSTKTFDFDKADDAIAAAEADHKGTIPPMIAAKNSMVKSVHQAAAEHYVRHGGDISTEPDAELDAAVRHHDAKIRTEGARVAARHADPLAAADVAGGRAVLAEGRSFHGTLDRYARFIRRRARFHAACGVPGAPSLAPDVEDLQRALDALLVRIERAITPAKPAAQAPRGVPLAQKIRELIGA